MNVRVTYGAALARYGFGEGHPFGPDRLEAFWDEMVRQGLEQRVDIAAPVAADDAAIARFHAREYIDRVKTQSESGTGFLDWGDTPAFKGVYEAAAFVVGSVLDAVRALLARECRYAFVPIAGLHHARRDGAAGFCVFNDIGVAIEALRAEFGVRRVAYVDIDAHHGDGVFYAFADDADLVFADIHEDGNYLYPGTGGAEETGTGAAAGSKLNLPMAPGSDDAAFHAVWPQVERFVRDGAPEFVLLQAGADSVQGDPITHMQFSPAVHAHAAARLCALAEDCCGGRLLALGGGGYNRVNLAQAWTGVVDSMLDAAPDN